MDTESFRERALAAYRQGPAAVVDLAGRLVAEFAACRTRLNRRSLHFHEALHDSCTFYTAQRETLSARLAALEAENAALRAKLGTNSHSSGMPPSSDGPGVKPQPTVSA